MAISRQTLRLERDLRIVITGLADSATRRLVRAWARAWNEVSLNGPYGSWWYPRYPNALANQVIWPPEFNPTLPSPNAWGGPPQFWQYSSTFPSIEGAIDANVFNGTFDQLRALNA